MDEAKRIADAAQAKQEAEARRKQQELLAQQMQSEIDDLASSAANAALAKQQAAQLREFTLAINRKIKSQWRRPPQVSGQLSTLMRITLIPGGEVTSVIVTKSSGNEAFDASVKDAVLRASPLPVPADAAVFRDNFRIFSLNYTTEE
jgi:colicin import membrane protein